jgi:regulator of sigma E protease
LTDQPGFLFTVLMFVLVIGPLVFVHELGHYLVGRWFGVHAEAFSIGFGPELFAWNDRRGTRWRIAALPLGGYVRFKGDLNAASMADPAWLELPAEERNRSFPAKPLGQRALIVAAGPITNFLFAILILAGFAVVYGERMTLPVIGQVVAGGTAAKADLRAGDRIVSVDGRSIDRFEDMSQHISMRADETIAIVFQRGSETIERSVPVGVVIEKDRFGNEYRIGRIGIGSTRPEVRDVSLLKAPFIATEQTIAITRSMIDGLGQIITGRRSLEEMGGPLKIAQISGEQAARGPEALIFLIALVSINLGFINLLPIPILDGGHLLFYGVEAIQRKPVSPRVQELAYRSGFALLIGLMIVVTFNDLVSFGLWEGLSGLIG